MSEMKDIYNAVFEVGQKVRIANRDFLECFQKTWKYHNPLTSEQIDYHDKIAVVESVGFYHGGDVLYRLVDITGIWHEQCLRKV